MRHANGEKWAGVDVDGVEGVRDNLDAFVWEPSLVKTNAIGSAVEAACLILSVDETVRNPQSEQASCIAFTFEFPLIGMEYSLTQAHARHRGRLNEH